MKKSIYTLLLFFFCINYVTPVLAQKTPKDGVGMNKSENKLNVRSTGETLKGISVTTKSVEEIIGTAAICKYIVKLKEPAVFSEQGICWSKTENPDIAANKISVAEYLEGESVAEITGLEPDTKYYVRAFVTSTAGTVYGKELSFTTTSGQGVSTYWIRRR